MRCFNRDVDTTCSLTHLCHCVRYEQVWSLEGPKYTPANLQVGECLQPVALALKAAASPRSLRWWCRRSSARGTDMARLGNAVTVKAPSARGPMCIPAPASPLPNLCVVGAISAVQGFRMQDHHCRTLRGTAEWRNLCSSGINVLTTFRGLTWSQR